MFIEVLVRHEFSKTGIKRVINLDKVKGFTRDTDDTTWLMMDTHRQDREHELLVVLESYESLRRRVKEGRFEHI